MASWVYAFIQKLRRHFRRWSALVRIAFSWQSHPSHRNAVADLAQEFMSYQNAQAHYSHFEVAHSPFENNTQAGEDLHVYQMWWQGLDDAPPIVRVCMASAKQHIPGAFHLLTATNFEEFIEIPGWLVDKVRKNKIRLAHFSDIVRCLLLTHSSKTTLASKPAPKLWLDATVFVSSNPSTMWRDKPFFAYRVTPDLLGGNSLRSISTWMLYLADSEKTGEIFGSAGQYLLDFWRHNSLPSHYFMFNHVLTALLQKNLVPDITLSIEESLDFDVEPHLMLLNWHRKFDNQLLMELTRRSHLHKLTYDLEFCVPNATFETYSLRDYLLKLWDKGD